MSDSVPIPDRRPSADGVQRRRVPPSAVMIANLNDVPSSQRDDSQSHSGSASHYAPEELAARIRELEIRVFGSQPPPSRAFSKQHSLPNESSQGGRADLLGPIATSRIDAIDGFSEEVDKDWKLEVKRWKRVPNRYGSADLYDASQKIEDIRRKEQVRNHSLEPPLISLAHACFLERLLQSQTPLRRSVCSSWFKGEKLTQSTFRRSDLVVSSSPHTMIMISMGTSSIPS